MLVHRPSPSSFRGEGLRLDPDPDAVLPSYVYPSSSLACCPVPPSFSSEFRPAVLIGSFCTACTEGRLTEAKSMFFVLKNKLSQHPEYGNESDISLIQDPKTKVSILLSVVQCQQHSVLDWLIQSGGDLNEAGPDRISVLFPLIARGQVGMIRNLTIKYFQHFDLEAVDQQGRTPLLFALQIKQIAAAQLLLSHGASVEAFHPKTNETVVSLTCRVADLKLRFELLQSMLDRRADIDKRFEIQLDSLLHSAPAAPGAFHLDPRMSKIRSISASKSASSASSSSPSSLEASPLSPSAVWLDLRTASEFFPGHSSSQSYSLLDLAIYSGDLNFVRWLMDAGANLSDLRVQRGLITLAVLFEQAELLNLMMKRRASISITLIMLLISHCIDMDNRKIMNLLLLNYQEGTKSNHDSCLYSSKNSHYLTCFGADFPLEDGLLSYCALTSRYSLVEEFASMGGAFSDVSSEWAIDEIRKRKKPKTGSFDSNSFKQAMAAGRKAMRKKWDAEVNQSVCRDVADLILQYADPYASEKPGKWDEVGFLIKWARHRFGTIHYDLDDDDDFVFGSLFD